MGAVPIARAAQLLELLENLVALLVAPVPNPLEKGFPTQIVTGLAFRLFEVLFDHGLGGNTRVVGAGNPERGLAFESGAAGQRILQGIVEHVPHVEDARYIGRWDDDRVRLLAFTGLARKTTGFLPSGIPLGFNIAGFVTLGDLWHDYSRNGRSNRPRHPLASAGLRIPSPPSS